MFFRSTQGLMKNDVVYNLTVHQRRMDKLQNSLSTGKKVRLPEDDPVAATNAMMYRTRINELRKFMSNIDEGAARLRFAENGVRRIVEIFQRLEELAVQGANSTYTKEDRAKIAIEVDQLLKEAVEIANSNYKGEYIFAGYKTDRKPFEVLTARPSFADREVITKVIYNGDNGEWLREIEQGEYVSANIPGNKVFWATNDAIVGSVNVANFSAGANYKIRIDGKVIQINAGDNINTIINKINNAKIPVRASLYNNQLMIEATTPHQIFIEDIEGGNLLQQLGIKQNLQKPNEVASTARRFGRTIFDVIIKLRDDLWQDNVKAIGGDDLGLIQKAMDSLLGSVGEIGARASRFEAVKKRLTVDELDTTELLANTENIDVAQVVMDLKMLEHVYRASLGVAGRIMPPTLLDFLR